MTTESPNVFTRHPRLTLAAVIFVGVTLILLGAELGLRTFGNLNIHYYVGFQLPGVHKFPYGDVLVNKDGCPDEEFVSGNADRRIGYLGDSIAYGVGAGYGYRIPDILQQTFPQYHNWVCGALDSYLDEMELVGQVTKLKLDSVVYLMILNDILPAKTAPNGTARPSGWVESARTSRLRPIDEGLRGTSYLYTHVRFGVKNALQRMGYEAHGLPAFELFPLKNRELIESTVDRIAAALGSLKRWPNIQACVIVLPYEMQISPDAARRYKELGFDWEEGFEAGSAQTLVMEAFQRHHVNAFDARQAFRNQDLKVGDAFVYNKGDKIDWNHPNRLGHAIIAAWLSSNSDFVSKCIKPTSFISP